MQESNDWLEQALRESEPYIDNDSFSNRVMGELPRKRRRSRISRRKRIVAASGLLGLVTMVSLGPEFFTIPNVSALIGSVWFLTVGTMAALGAVAVAAWWLLAVRE